MKTRQFKLNPHAEFFFADGKIPPQALDFEEAILGAILIESDNDWVREVLVKMQPGHYYKEAHGMIFKACKQLHKEGFPVDSISVIEQCRKNGEFEMVGGNYFVTALMMKVSSSANIAYHFRIVYQKWLQREMIRICSETTRKAYEDGTDCFDLLEEVIEQLEKLDPLLVEAVSVDANALAKEMVAELEYVEDHRSRGLVMPAMTYATGWKRFDEVVTLGRDKIILIAGAAKAGKSRFIRAIIFILLELYTDVSVCWISLEDSRQDIMRSYLASKVYITAKHIKSRQYPKDKIPEMKRFTEQFKKFDIEFIDQSIKSAEIVNHYIQFCESRKDKFNILVVDNILSLDDQMDFKFDANGFCNHVMQNLLKCRQKTKGLIFALHHFNDAQQDKDNLKTGYRPVLKDMKGSETFRRTPNQVLLINSFNIYKDLMSEYNGNQKSLLNQLFLVDTGANREDKINDTIALLHFFTEMAYDQFWEIPIPELPPIIAPKPTITRGEVPF